ncbi:DUF4276 family protein [Microcoleus sp.]|uniref:DUF4276 family protein n=1 Tax=Microcoleus sp. TaxID=44472 RepID=UPI0035249D2D
MKIAIIVEGKTEKAFMPILRTFLMSRLQQLPDLDPKPPSKHIQEIFELGKCRDSYSKTRDAPRILKDQDLMKAVNECPELKAFVNTILLLCNGDLIP